MSAPRIKVHPHQWHATRGFSWAACTWCGVVAARRQSIAEAADAGRAHLRTAHPEAVWAAGGTVYDKEAIMFDALDQWAADHPELDEATVGTYCRTHGARRDVCGCQVVSVDPDGENGREKPVQRFALSHECATCGSSAASCDQSPNGCCFACSATGGCTHQPIADFGNNFPCCATPVQRAHNHHSREGA